MTAADRLAGTYRGFREHFLGYAEIEAQLRAWAEAFPHLVRLSSIGRSAEGRELWIVTLGPDPDRRRPSVWVDGNIHASELCGSSVALAIAEDVLRFHTQPDAPLHDLSEPVRAALHDVLFFVLPRLSPDGSEAVLTTGRWVRSVPRDERPDRARARWVAGDVDGDGLSLVMRQRDPTGELVEASGAPGVLVQRDIDDAGPFYKLYPEGTIEGFDGTRVPDPHFLSDNFPDLNRNFPWSWQPDPDQIGAGDYPASEPEARAVVEHAIAHPEIFAWLNLHTFGGVFIRPLGNAPDTKMDPSDLAVFRQLAEWGEQLTGYPTVSGYEEFTYEPDKPLHGDESDFAYHQRGAIGYVCELWDLFEQLGLPRKKRFVDRYSEIGRDEIVRLWRWDAEHNRSRVFLPWRPFQHPQLGAVEVGGFDPRVGVWNPPLERVAEVCRAQSATFLRVASLAPRPLVARLEARALGGDLFQIEASIENHGYLPTYVLASSRKLPWNEPLSAELSCSGPTLVSGDDARRDLGHLEGWGSGKHGRFAPLHVPRTRGSASRAVARWVVRGRGTIMLRAGSCRVGWVERLLEV